MKKRTFLLTELLVVIETRDPSVGTNGVIDHGDPNGIDIW